MSRATPHPSFPGADYHHPPLVSSPGAGLQLPVPARGALGVSVPGRQRVAAADPGRPGTGHARRLRTRASEPPPARRRLCAATSGPTGVGQRAEEQRRERERGKKRVAEDRRAESRLPTRGWGAGKRDTAECSIGATHSLNRENGLHCEGVLEPGDTTQMHHAAPVNPRLWPGRGVLFVRTGTAAVRWLMSKCARKCNYGTNYRVFKKKVSRF